MDKSAKEFLMFDYELPGGDIVEVNAKITPGLPERKPDLNHPGDPAEDPVVEITDCFLRDSRKNNPDLPIDLDGLYIRETDTSGQHMHFTHINNELEEMAWEKKHIND